MLDGSVSRRDFVPPPSQEYLDAYPAAEDDFLSIWDAGEDDYVIPPRAWLLGNVFCRKFLSSILADGGTGKTALRVAQLISLAIGRSLTGEHVFVRCRVLIVSLEDDKDELRRRVYAVLKHHDILPVEVKGWLFLAAPKGLRLAEMVDGAPAAASLLTLLDDAIVTLGCDIVSLDPFVKSHGVEENNNNAIDYVCTLLTKLAIKHDCAIDAPHHTKKGISTAGDSDSGRGASSMKDAARLVYTLKQMAPQEAELFGINERERRQFIRMDNGKVNIAPPSGDATWFRLIGVPLGNGSDLYPYGDNIQTVEPWQPEKIWDGLNNSLLNRILDDIDAGMESGQRYSTSNAAKDRAVWRVVLKHAPEKNEKQAKEIIKAWMNSGTLFTAPYDDPVERKPFQGVQVNHGKRPS